MNKIVRKWYKSSDKLRFAIVGIFNAGVMYFIYSVFIFTLGEASYQTALILAWVLSSVTSFFIHKKLVFNTKGNVLKEYLKCCSTWVISYFINAILLEFFVKYLYLNVFLSQILAPAIAGVFTYFMFKKVAFKRGKNAI